MDDCAEPSLAARRDARRLGIAIAAMIPIIATTMRSSIREKPSWRLFVFISKSCSFELWLLGISRHSASSQRLRAALSANCYCYPYKGCAIGRDDVDLFRK